MRTANVSILLASLLLLTVAACSTAPPDLGGSTRNLTPGMVQSRVKVGQTNQTEVLEAFGAPNIVTRDRGGQEVWTYDVQSMSHSGATTSRSGSLSAGAAGVAGTVPIIGGLSGGGSKSTSTGVVSSSTFTLIIKFDENQVVSDYNMQSTRF